MHKNRVTKILINVCLVGFVVVCALVTGYLLSLRGECMEKTVDGKTETVCVRDAQFR